MNNTDEKKKRAVWVDAAKFIAILGVLVDHSYGSLYTDERIMYASYYSVSLFILMMGAVSFWSCEKHRQSLPGTILSKCLNILRVYAEATFIYCIFEDKAFRLDTFVNHLIRFDASPPLYYVILYVQLLAAAPLIYNVLTGEFREKKGMITEVLGFAAVIVISGITTKYTNLLDIYGGGGKLFGGSYLCLLYIGMWFGKYCRNIPMSFSAKFAAFWICVLLSAGCCGFIITDQFRLDARFDCGPGTNPPGISLCTYAVLIAAAMFFLGEVLSERPVNIASRIFYYMAFVGKKTLYIFLYHKLFLDYIFVIPTGIGKAGSLICRIITFIGILLCPLLLQLIIEKVRSRIGNFIVKSYKADV